MSKRWLIVLLQTAVTAALLAFFFHKPEFRTQILSALQHANPVWIVIGICFAGVENIIGVCRWRIFLRMLGMQLPFWKAVQVCLVALFCNTFLLGAAGGDLIRAAYLIRQGNSKTDSLLSVVLDRISGLGALIIYTVALTILNHRWLMESPAASLLIKAVLIYQAGTVALMVFALYFSATGWTNNPPKWAPFPKLLTKLGAGYGKLAHCWPDTLRATGLSMAMLLGYFGVFFSSARAFGVPISYLEMATLMPIVDIITALPISIGGVGWRETIFTSLLGELIGTPEGTAFSVSFVGFLMNTSWGLVGAAIMPFFKGIVKDARTAASDLRSER